MITVRCSKYRKALLNDPDWRAILGYEGLYEVHWKGAVRNTITKELLRPGRSTAGYLTVSLYKNSVSKTFTVHRLVAMHFIDNNENKRCVNHKTGNKTNNHISNLEWVTHKENNDHAIMRGLRKTKVSSETIKQIASMHIRGDSTFGTAGLANLFGLHKSTVYEILNKHKTIYNDRN